MVRDPKEIKWSFKVETGREQDYVLLDITLTNPLHLLPQSAYTLLEISAEPLLSICFHCFINYIPKFLSQLCYIEYLSSPTYESLSTLSN